MEKKTVRTRKQKVVDPFAELAEAPAADAAPKRAIKVIKKAAVQSAGDEVPATTVAKSPLEEAVKAKTDAFAEVADAAKPRKRAATVKAKAASSEPKPIKKRVAKTVAAAKSVDSVEKPKRVKKKPATTTPESPIVEPAILEAEAEVSPVFKALADVSLPELKRENRARLMLQSPTAVYFYWSIRENPYHLLKNAFGSDVGSYTLVVKLKDLRHDTEELHPCEAEGDWWFAVEPDGEYRAEIGFYAPNRPYFRVLYSNSVETPRRTPSPHPASDAQWTVSSTKFAEVLDVSGFKRDAIDVAIAGDEPQLSTDVSHKAFAHFLGSREHLTRGVADENVRHVLLSFAAGATLEDVRFQIGPRLFEVLQANADKLTPANAKAALTEYFEIGETELTSPTRSAVHGASLVHFPSALKVNASALRPVSS